ncbi:hypothetical protein [Actinoplanes utahensis]|uniref:hypothetical protein n=1 Tax=Actinoplanes utahensis TaxID=1869 RepID=UPI00126A713E|nr:hypothetical protein [Actinoplanes utahensis]
MARTLPAWGTFDDADPSGGSDRRSDSHLSNGPGGEDAGAPASGSGGPDAGELSSGSGGQGAGEVLGEPDRAGGRTGESKVIGQPTGRRQRGVTGTPSAPATSESPATGTQAPATRKQNGAAGMPGGAARMHGGTAGVRGGAAEGKGSEAGKQAREPGDRRDAAGKQAEEPGGEAGKQAGKPGGGAEGRVVGDVGLGDARSVLLSGGPVQSAGAARILNGRVAGAEDADLVIQQAPPVNPKANERRTGSKKFGPVKVGAGALTARAAWTTGMECDPAAADASAASAEISRVTVTGGGSGALVRVPERISSRSGTALRQRAGITQTVASATITAGRISLVDNEVRIRVLRAPELRASMTADRQGRVDYQPAIVEVSSRGGKQVRLTTAGDHIDITLSEEMRPLESLPAPIGPVGDLPLPKIPRLPVIGEPENAPAPTAKPGSTLRVSLGEVRQAREGDAIAARATAIRMTLTRNADKNGNKADAPSGVVADLGIGMLEAAAVAPTGGDSAPGRSTPSDSVQGVSPAGTGAGSTGLPITGPRVIGLIIAGAGLVLGGICAVALTSRRRRNEP